MAISNDYFGDPYELRDDDQYDARLKMSFGKYRGRLVSMVVREDPAYAEWCLTQEEMCHKYPEVIEVMKLILTRDNKSTPVHNKLQLQFMNDAFRSSIVSIIEGSPFAGESSVQFEHKGVDVVVSYKTTRPFPDKIERQVEMRLLVEIKPSISDDYPSVLRQVQYKRDAVNKMRYPNHMRFEYIVYTESFNSRAVTLKDVKNFFKCSGVKLMLGYEVWVDGSAPL